MQTQIVIERLHKLEGENRRLKLIGSIALLFISVVFLMGQTLSKPKIVAAEAFLLIDKNNKSRGAFSIAPDGSASLVLSGNSKKHNRIDMKVWPEGVSAITISDTKGNRGIALAIVDDSPMLDINNKAGKSGISLRGRTVKGSDDSPGIIISDVAGNKRAIFSIMSDIPMISLNDKKEDSRIMIGVNKEGNPLISLMDVKGKNLFKAP